MSFVYSLFLFAMHSVCNLTIILAHWYMKCAVNSGYSDTQVILNIGKVLKRNRAEGTRDR